MLKKNGKFKLRVEDELQVQACWCLEQAEEEASYHNLQRRQPFHQGAMCLQGQASQQDCPSAGNDEVQGAGHEHEAEDQPFHQGATCFKAKTITRIEAQECEGLS